MTGRTPLSQQLASIAAQTRRVKTPYRLDAGDLVAVIVEGVLSFKDAPVHLPKKGSAILPGMGYPVPVMEDGTIAMPIVKAISVRGLTVEQARKKVASTYYSQNIVKPSEVVLLSLLRKRTVNVTVIHSKPNSTSQDVSIVKLTPGESNVLGALGQIGSFDTDADIQVFKSSGQQVGAGSALAKGDVVDMRSPDPEYFYTGGLLPGGQFELPRDRNLSLVQAIALAGGSVGGGRLASFPPSDLVVIRAGRPAFTIDVNRALRTPGGYAVRPGDTLMLRYKNAEIAISRWLSRKATPPEFAQPQNVTHPEGMPALPNADQNS